jgi:hypothetical protein
MAYGINETRPNLDRYRRTLRQAGLKVELIASWLTYQMCVRDLTSWANEMQICTPETAPRLRNEPPDREIALRQRWSEYLLRERGAAVIIVAEKAPRSLPWATKAPSPTERWWH